MSGFTADNIEQIVAACRENVSGIAESLNLCIDRQDRIEIGETTGWTAETVPAELDGPGLAVVLTVAGQTMLCLIPASLPLPEWYTHPGESEEARLQTLAMEWSMNLLPAELEAESFESVAVGSLRQVVSESESPDAATILELRLLPPEVADAAAGQEAESPADGDDAETPGSENAPDAENPPDAENTADAEGIAAEPSGEDASPAEAESASGSAGSRMFLVWPVTSPALPVASESEPAVEAAPAQDTAAGTDAAGTDAAGTDAAGTDAAAGGMPSTVSGDRGLSSQARRVLGLPVTVVVRLAEKKIELGQLLSLTPGYLLTFNKPCEDLLDLYVNNQRYCQGEAVKIGEKFGLKITQVGVVDKREPHILQS